MNSRRILYFADLICEKIDLHLAAFILRIEALKKGDMERVEFVEKMMLEPLEKQIAYLADKASKIGRKEM